MSVQVRARREAAAFLSTYVGAQGELLVDTTNNRVQVHDGATPGGWPAARLAEVVANTRTSLADAAYNALASDRTIAVTSLTAARTITLPAAAAYPTGTQLLVFDESGACSATNTITLARAGTDTINGSGSAVISTAYGYLALESNGAGKWTVVDQTPAASTGSSAAVAPPRSAVRQTVQGGPQSAGAPNFLPATSASLSLTAQNVSTGVNTLTIAAAQGYNSTGQNDVISALTSNPTWSSLAASATSYLWVNASSGTTGSTTLQPIYQFGGTIATTNGQFTFDYQAMVGYVGNGTSAVATPLIFVGEADTSPSAVTATRAYAYNGYYESTPITTAPAAATYTQYQSNLGCSIATAYLDYTITAAGGFGGYVQGEKILNLNSFDGTYIHAVSMATTRNTIGFTTGKVSTDAFDFWNKTTGVVVNITAGAALNGQMKFIHKRLF